MDRSRMSLGPLGAYRSVASEGAPFNSVSRDQNGLAAAHGPVEGPLPLRPRAWEINLTSSVRERTGKHSGWRVIGIALDSLYFQGELLLRPTQQVCLAVCIACV